MNPKRLLLTCLCVCSIGAGLTELSAQTVQVDLVGMTPHVGQLFEARLIDKQNLREVDRVRVDAIPAANFSITLEGEIGASYWLDFYADLNQNGHYDAPPADHAWRLDADDLASGTNTLTFNHAPPFTDVDWRHAIYLHLSDMSPHVGQRFEVRVRDINQTGKEVGRVVIDAIPQADFTVVLPFVIPGRSYWLDFYADLNQNGHYDAPPADHAWRLQVDDATGDIDVNFTHAPPFTDIGPSGMLSVHFSGMTPHVGQMLELRVLEKNAGKEIGRHRRTIIRPDFVVEIPGLRPGVEYEVDFYADLNQNGLYDEPPTDHAWSESFVAGAADHSLNFSHNTNFHDIEWKYLFTLEALGMNPHLGQKFELRLLSTGDMEEEGRFTWEEILVPHFFICVPGLEYQDDYFVDFYADLNKNGHYDAPPTDHAWREEIVSTNGDVHLVWNHNTNFTDIMFPSAVREIAGLRTVKTWPNPASDVLHVELHAAQALALSAELIPLSSQGPVLLSRHFTLPAGTHRLAVDGLAGLPAGIYWLRLADQRGGMHVLPVLKN